jgi:hypothetical protein
MESNLPREGADLLPCRDRTICCLFYERSNGAWPREVNSMASLYFYNFRTGALRHHPLCIRWNHFVVGRNQVPTGVGFPRWFAHHSAECLHAPGNLGISHKSGQARIHICGERSRELGTVQARNPSCGGRIGGTGAPGAWKASARAGVGFLNSVSIDSLLSGANAAT